MAEIPTFQAGRIDQHAYAQRIAANAHLTMGGGPVTLVPLRSALAHPRGAAGLRTTRLEVILAGPVLSGRVSVSYHDNNYRNRIGWKEVVVGAAAPSTSHELRAYPKDLLQSPLDVTSATAMLAPRGGPDHAPTLSSGVSLEAPDRVTDSGFASLVGRLHLSAHGHDHGHHHHEHAPPTLRSLLAVGISGGLLPCPSALVVLLAAISLHRIAFGLILILAFSAGLALSITGIGLVAVLARNTFRRVGFDGPL